MELLAIDTSYYEPVKNWSDSDPFPQHIIARATYGVRQDTEFLHTWKFCLDYGIPRAAYHYWYGTPMYNGRTASEGIGDQADNFVRQIMLGGYTGVEKLWLDLESYGNTTVPNGKNYRNLSKQWLDHVERETGQKPGIYSRKDQLARMMILGLMPSWIHDYDIWLAYYPNNWEFATFPILQPGHRFYPSWLKPEKLVMHQYTDQGRIPSLRSKTNNQEMRFDFNYMYPGYFETLKATSTEEVNMQINTWYSITAADGLKVRQQPSTSSQILQVLNRYDKVYVIRDEAGDWVKISRAFRGTTEIALVQPSNSYVSSSYLIPTSAPETVPTPTPTPDPVLVELPEFLDATVIINNLGGLTYKGTLAKQ